MMRLRKVASSTIGLRLLLVVLVPTVGLIFFGATAASDEREASRLAGDLRTEAELVGLLSEVSVRLGVEQDAIRSIEQAATLGVDLDTIDGGWDLAIDSWVANSSESEALMQTIGEVEPELWADPTAVEEMLDAWAPLGSEEINRTTLTAAPQTLRTVVRAGDASFRALGAQNARLDDLLAEASLDGELVDAVESLRLSLALADAARNERQALSGYLLPFSSDGELIRFRRVAAATTRFDLVQEDLRRHLTASQIEEMDLIEASTAWANYESLRQETLNGEKSATPTDAPPLATLGEGLTLQVDGFDRINLLITQHLRLSDNFTNAAIDLERDAEQRLLASSITGIALTGLAALLSLITTRSIQRPVRGLLRRAEAIASGDLEAASPGSAPHDIAMVHGVLDEMSANLQTVSQQAAALSDGRLDDEVFNETVVGLLGESVRGSVKRLRSVTSKLEYEANHDPLTGLPNRSALLSLLDRCLTGPESARTPVSLVMIDLDGFKAANDQLGHTVGDEVLAHVASRLRNERRGTFVCRLGGDEFMMVVTGDDCIAKSRHLSKAVLDAISRPIATGGGTVTLSASAGIVTTKGPSWLAPSEMLRRVDLALYEAKDESGGVAVHFDQRLHDSLLATTQLQGEIRKAVERDEFDMHLQPIVAMDERRTVGFESLLRWDSPTRGPVSPGLFIPVAEQSDLITQVDLWVMNRAAAILGRWRHDAPLSDKTLSVNVSARHISHPELVPRIATALGRHGGRPEQLLIEVTESQLIPNLARAEDNLRTLGAIGVRLAIDDFGTGYASVAHLRRVSFDRIKIDQSFFSNLEDETNRSLTELLISVGREMDLEVVAEGIETEEQYEWAKQAGCTHAQGYLLGRPVAIKTPAELGPPGRRNETPAAEADDGSADEGRADDGRAEAVDDLPADREITKVDRTDVDLQSTQ